MADPPVELLFCDSFKHGGVEQNGQVDMVQFPGPVLIQEVRVIPQGVRAHSNLPDPCAYGETTPRAFQLELFFSNITKPNLSVFERLGSLDYEEPSSIIFKPNNKVNTDGLVVRGWYSTLTLAVYGVVERGLSRPHERESPPPPPPPPPHPGVQPGPYKRPQKYDEVAGREWDVEEQFVRSPPRHQPRGPRTPPGPPPPDDDDDEVPILPVAVSRDDPNAAAAAAAVAAAATAIVAAAAAAASQKEFFPAVSPDRPCSQPSEERFSEEGEPAGEEEGNTGGEDEEEEEEIEDEVVDEEMEAEEGEEGEEGESHAAESMPDEDDEEGDGDSTSLAKLHRDDGYEQISSDEECIPDAEHGAYKYPNFDLEHYTAEELASVPAMSYDPLDKELASLAHFSPPYLTRFEVALASIASNESKQQEEGSVERAEQAERLRDLLEAHEGDLERNGPKWVTALEEAPALLPEGLSWLRATAAPAHGDALRRLVAWCRHALGLDAALVLPIAINLRQLKGGLKLAGTLAECGADEARALVAAGVIELVVDLLFAEHMASSLKLGAMKALDSLVSTKEGVRSFLGEAGQAGGASGYQRLLDLILSKQTVRVATAASAVLQKCHFYELVVEVERAVEALSEGSKEPRRRRSTEGTGTGDSDLDSSDDTDDPESMCGGAGTGARDLDRLAMLLEEMQELLVRAPHCMLQLPIKCFPTPARITGPPERDDPMPALFRYMHEHHFLESLALLLCTPAASLHAGVQQASRDVLAGLAATQPGLLFLGSHPEAAGLLVRALAQLAEQPDHEDGPAPAAGGGAGAGGGGGGGGTGSDPALALRLAYSLQALQCVSELFECGARVGGEGDTDNSGVLGILHSLYLMTFHPTGRAAVCHVLGLDRNLGCLIPFVDQCCKEGQQGEVKSKKSVASNYACMLVLLAVQLSSEVAMLEHYGTPLLHLCKEDEGNAKLQELSRWLEPVKDLHFEISSIPALTEYIKQNLDSLTIHVAHEGPGLATALRVLKHIACPPPPIKGQQKDLRWNLAVIQLFSADALDLFIRVLQKLSAVLLQAWRHHAGAMASLQRSLVLSIATCALSLLQAMLAELLGGGPQGGGFELRDSRLPAALVSLHTVLCSVPLSGQLEAEEQQVQTLAVDTLLAFTQGVGEQAAGSGDTLASNTWSLMLREVLDCTLAAPESFYSGLLLLTELLPLPLPMHAAEPLSAQDVTTALNMRKLWSLHLRAQADTLAELMSVQAATGCQPLQMLLRRVAVQLADLAALPALMVLRATLQLLQSQLTASESVGCLCSPLVARVLGFLDALVAHASCKAAFLSIVSGSVKGDEHLTEMLPAMLAILRAPVDGSVHQQQAQDCVSSILQSLCDQDISLCPSVSGEGSAASQDSPLLLLAANNNVPCRDALAPACDALLELLGRGGEPAGRGLLCGLRALALLADHSYGLYHVRCALRKHPHALFGVVRGVAMAATREAPALADHTTALLSALLELLRPLLGAEHAGHEGEEAEGEEHEGSSAEATATAGAAAGTTAGAAAWVMSVAEARQQFRWGEPLGVEHPLVQLEKLVTDQGKEEEGLLEGLLEGMSALRRTLDSPAGALPLPPADSDVPPEPTLPPPESLQQMFTSRTVFVLTESPDERFTSSPFLSSSQVEDMDLEMDMVRVDLLELAEKTCNNWDLREELETALLREPSSPGGASRATKSAAKLGKRKHETFITSSGKSDYLEPAKRAHMSAAPRGRGRGSFSGLGRMNDIFRLRKQNTSRPPSMHVDDFVAVGSPVGILPTPPMVKRLPKGMPKGPLRGSFSGGRGGGRGSSFHQPGRFFNPPINKGTYGRREGGRGSSWVSQALPRGGYADTRGVQGGFPRTPPVRTPPTGYRPAPRDRAPRGRGNLGVVPWGGGGGGGGGGGSSGGGGNNLRGKFVGRGGGGGRHIRSFTR
ncbi:protein virilizer homolog isoform X2 [Petromyzon marinus]|uniref:protein virilizer homolog isoform X2 n=1 Tax=Petromyzon marinus TaxID=7757 RepID=UPI003F6F305B